MLAKTFLNALFKVGLISSFSNSNFSDSVNPPFGGLKLKESFYCFLIISFSMLFFQMLHNGAKPRADDVE
ncbi:hypothetical protein DN748_10480 [Sinomicrobium soli]|nr:hypothetical protein DN748_10480 [Sinomicrobium sp. N-1-3-6]